MNLIPAHHLRHVCDFCMKGRISFTFFKEKALIKLGNYLWKLRKTFRSTSLISFLQKENRDLV